MSSTQQRPLDGEAVLRRRPSPAVEWVEVSGEVVAWNEEAESLHLLDPIASMIFQLCDGTASLDATAEELADAFDQDPARVRADVRAFAGSLVELGVVEEVR